MAEAGSSPASTAASPGVTPVDPTSALTPTATSPRMSSAICLPSMIVAVTRVSPPARQWHDSGSGRLRLRVGYNPSCKLLVP